MKRLIPLLMALVIGQAMASQRAPEIEIDITMERITSLLADGREREALPHFARLEAMQPKLPEAFDFYYVRSLERAGQHREALKRANAYFASYGRKGKYYKEVVPIAGRATAEVEKQDQQRLAAYEQAMVSYNQAMGAHNQAMAGYQRELAEYESTMRQCPSRHADAIRSARTDVARSEAACNPPNHTYSCDYHRRHGFSNGKGGQNLRTLERRERKLYQLESMAPSEYCAAEYQAPKKPVAPVAPVKPV